MRGAKILVIFPLLYLDSAAGVCYNDRTKGESAMLVCPKCGKRLVREGQSYRCERGHCYDVARQGYTNLLIRKQKESGDNAGMVKIGRAHV